VRHTDSVAVASDIDAVENVPEEGWCLLVAEVALAMRVVHRHERRLRLLRTLHGRHETNTCRDAASSSLCFCALMLSAFTTVHARQRHLVHAGEGAIACA